MSDSEAEFSDNEGITVSNATVEALLKKGYDNETIATKKLGFGRDLFKSRDDKKSLRKLPEMEREETLYERSVQRQDMLESIENTRRKLGLENVTRLDDDLRSMSDASSDYSDYDDYAPAAKKRRKRTYDEDKIITLKEAKSLQVSRNVLLKYCEEPFFDELIGAFVRFGNIDADQKYSLGEIIGVKKAKWKYKLENGVYYDKVLVVQTGGVKQEVKINFVSNSAFETAEFEKWIKLMISSNEEVVSIVEAEEVLKRIKKNVFNHVYTPQEVREKVEKNKKQRRKRRKLNFTLEKAELKRQLETLKKNNENGENTEQIVEVENEISALELQRKEYLESLRPRTSITSINKRHNEENIKTLETISMKRAKGLLEKNDENPYARQPCRPRTLWSTNSPAQKHKGEEEGDKPEPKSSKMSTSNMFTKRQSLQHKPDIKNKVNTALENAMKLVDKDIKPTYEVVQDLRVKPKKLMSIEEYMTKQTNRAG